MRPRVPKKRFSGFETRVHRPTIAVSLLALGLLGCSSTAWEEHRDGYNFGDLFDRVESVERFAMGFNESYDLLPEVGSGQSACDLYASSLVSDAQFVASAAVDLDAGREQAALDLTWQEHYDELLGGFMGKLAWFRDNGCPQAEFFAGIP